MRFDRQKFFDGYTAAFAAPKQGQREGLEALLAAVEADPDVTDIRWLAYMFATTKHECADTWKPIEEYGKGKNRKYGAAVTVKDPQGNSYSNVYYGRGFVQLTWDYNYKNMGNALGNRMLYEPGLALHPDVAYRIMSHGMRRGSFTGKKLADYINDHACDYHNARKIINGLDQAERIAGYAVKLEKILRDSVVPAMAGVPSLAPQPQAQPQAVPAPAGAALFTVTASKLNVRTGPMPGAVPVQGSPIPAGTLVQGMETQGEWRRIVAQGTVNGVPGVSGWVSAQYLQPAGGAPAPAVALFTVNASKLNVRGAPAPTAAPVAGSPLPNGTVVQGMETQGEWRRVVVPGAVNGVAGITGWVSAQYLLPASPAHV